MFKKKKPKVPAEIHIFTIEAPVHATSTKDVVLCMANAFSFPVLVTTNVNRITCPECLLVHRRKTNG